MNAPQNLDDMDDVDLAALSTRVLHDMVAKMTPEKRQRYRDALDAADAPLRSFLGAALGTPETSPFSPGQKCATCRGAFSGMPWDTLCPSCWEEALRNESAKRRAPALPAGDAQTAAARDVIPNALLPTGRDSESRTVLCLLHSPFVYQRGNPIASFGKCVPDGTDFCRLPLRVLHSGHQPILQVTTGMLKTPKDSGGLV